MNKLIKKTVSAVTALAVTLSAAVMLGISKKLSAEEYHTHKICADSGHANCAHLRHKYDPFPTGENSPNTITSNKNYYLTDDLTDATLINKYIFVDGATVNLCLNGHTISTKGFKVYNNGVLNICDCKTGGCIQNYTQSTSYTGGVLIADNGGKLNVYGGNIRAQSGIAIHSGDSSTTTIYGGEIIGGCIMADNGSVLSIYGGTIKNEADDCNGISVLNNADVYINGGTIAGGKYGIAANYSGSNININGGSVESRDNSALYIQNGVICTITDGTFTSTNHSAVYTLDEGIVNINGGDFTGTDYPTVWIDNEGIANISGGNISNSGYKSYIWNSGTMVISGGVFSANNMDKGYIRNYGKFGLQGSPTLINTYIWLSSDDNITISGALENNDKYTVYVDSSLPRTFTSGWDTHMTDKNASKYFNSTYDNSKIVYRANEAAIVYYYRITYDANGGSCMVASAEANASDKLAGFATPTRDGYIFDGWFTEADGGEKITADTVFTDDTTIYAHWTCDHSWGDAYEKDDTRHWQACTKCGAESEKSNHTWNDGEETTPPTETTEGVMTYKCTVCNAEKTEKIDKLPHTHTFSDDWTSDENGHWHAATCGHNVKSGEAEHNFGEPTVKPSTCTQHGSEEYVCQTCGYKKTVTLALAEHSFDGEWQKDENQHWQVCTKCGTESEKSNHTWNDGEVTIPPAETTEGVMTYKCTVCNAEKTEKIDKLPHTHTFSDDWASDENGHWHSATCGHNVKSGEAEHNFGEPTVKPSTCTQHGSEEYVCQTCGYKKTVTLALAEHSFDGEWQKDENNHWKVCTVCNAEKSEEAPHSWNGGEITKQPTEDEAGVTLYTCTVCQATKTELIAPLGHTHNWSSEWSKDDTYHWHACLNNCGEKKDNGAHIWDGGTITKQPAADAEGERTFECTVCGQTKTETIPATDEPSEPDSGNISFDVQPGENAPETNLKTPFHELADAVLTPEEQGNIENGTDIKIILIVNDATESVPTDDKAKTETAIRELSDYKLGQYLDITILKKIGDQTAEKITQTSKSIRVTFMIPSALCEKAEYSVVRVHGGETTVLKDLDSDPNTVTIETDKFSTYALVYKEKNTPSDPGGDNTSGENPGDSTNPPATTAPTESDSSDYTTSDDVNPPRDDSSDTTPIESKPTDEGNPGTTSSDDGNTTPSDDDNTAPSESEASSSVSDHSPSESSPSEDNGNPSTGIAVSLIPLAAAAVLMVAVKHKKK